MGENQPGFRLLDHPADVGIEAWGRILTEAFEQAALGLMSIIVDPRAVQCKEVRQIQLKSNNLETLLVKWLEEVLYLYDGQRFVGAEYHVEALSFNGLTARILGEPFSEGRHKTRTDVKAVTYHQLRVEETAAVTTVRVFLDI
jgi:SHS2 domain-containing protein